ncbi:testis-expressed protein 9 isoform 1-T1 [Synchiropus picturatus]
MAATSFVRRVASAKRVSRSGEPFMAAEARPKQKSTPSPKNSIDDLLAKEEEYKMRNAALEAKAADLVSQADQLLGEVLSNSSSTHLDSDSRGGEGSRKTNLQETDDCLEVSCSIQHRPQKVAPQKRVLSQKSVRMNDKPKETPAETFISQAIQSIEEKMTGDSVTHVTCAGETVQVNDEDEVISVALTRVAKARLRIMQEELDQLSSEYYKKDDENTKLAEKLKHLEDDRVRHEKSTVVLKAQLDKHKAFVEESAKKCDALQTEASILRKELENQKRSHKQAVAAHNTLEVRLARALEEVEKLKTQLATMKQTNKDLVKEESTKRETLLAENKMLQKQKSELIMGFKKQLKLIDILKKQKMHFEAAKLLSFTEEEFVKALDWGSGE